MISNLIIIFNSPDYCVFTWMAMWHLWLLNYVFVALWRNSGQTKPLNCAPAALIDSESVPLRLAQVREIGGELCQSYKYMIFFRERYQHPPSQGSRRGANLLRTSCMDQLFKLGWLCFQTATSARSAREEHKHISWSTSLLALFIFLCQSLEAVLILWIHSIDAVGYCRCIDRALFARITRQKKSCE